MADLDALEGTGLSVRPNRRTPAVAPAWQAFYRSAALVGAIGSAILEASLRESSAVEFAERAQRTARAILRSHGVEVHRIGKLPRVPSLLVSNHVSYLDALVIGSLVPCISIAKAETSRWPLFGAGLRALGVVFVARADAASGAVALRAALRALRLGASVLNFPEGTTTDGSVVRSFRRGSFGLGRLAGVPIVPVRIVYDDDRVPWFGGQQFGSHYVRLARASALLAHVHFGDPLARCDDEAGQVAARARGAVCAMGVV